MAGKVEADATDIPRATRRSEMQLLTEILAHLQCEPSRVQRLMNACNMSYRPMKKRLVKLIKKGYVLENKMLPKTGKFYTLSTNGDLLLHQLRESFKLVWDVLE